MAITVQNFIKLANFYNQMSMLMSAICVQKGGIAIENYVGRYFAADVLEYIAEYGRRLRDGRAPGITPQINTLIDRFDEQYARVKELTTPTQKPIYEMTLEEFEKIMNI
ncbi:MAG: hypothetical protein NC311_02775 [Muribaculaceae bacterium]|nr:hypothetical protein [Muribaculaceae bacterium]